MDLAEQLQERILREIFGFHRIVDHAQAKGVNATGVKLKDGLKRGGVSYTVDTVRDYVRRFPAAQLFYLIGADHIPQLPKWREADGLAGLVEFVVIARPGQVAAPLPTPFRGETLNGFPLGVSSSQIRERVRAGLPIELLVGSAVAEAIRNNRLYL